MSSNIPLTHSTEDKNQDQKMAQTKVPSLDKSGSASKTVTEKQRNQIVKKDLYLHWTNQGLIRKLKQNRQRNQIVKQYLYNYPVQMIKNWQDWTQMT